MFDFQVPRGRIQAIFGTKIQSYPVVRHHQIKLFYHLGKEVVVFSLLVNGNGTLLIKRMRGSFVKLQFHFCLAKNGDSSAKF